MIRYDDNSVMPGNGIHAGKKLANIPSSYFIWLWENDKCFGSLKEYIRENLENMKLEVKQNNKDKFR